MRIAAIVRFPANLPTYGSPYGEGDENTDNLRTIRSFADTMMHRTGSRPARSRSQCDPRLDMRSSSGPQPRHTPKATVGTIHPSGFSPLSMAAALCTSPTYIRLLNHCCFACFICFIRSRFSAAVFVNGLSGPYDASKIFSARSM